MDALERYRGREDLRLEELLAAANGLLPEMAGPPRHGKAREGIDERTVRYYVAEGLVDRPVGYAGTAALYGFRHLLQLLAIKRLQSDGLPLRAIEGFTAQPDAELERLLAPPDTSRPGQAATEYLTRLLSGGASARMAAPLARPPAAPVPEPRSLPSEAASPRTWARHELADGIELHVASDVSTLSSEERHRALERARAVLRKLKP